MDEIGSNILLNNMSGVRARNAEKPKCLSCEALLTARALELSTPFCLVCRQRKNIDPMYDDLGGPG